MSIHDDSVNPEIDALVARFPRLFKGQRPRVWSDLPRGWIELAQRLFADIDAMVDDDAVKHFEIIQIKEKFGGLRVYWDLGKEHILAIDIHGAGSVQGVELIPAKPTALFDRIRARVHQASEQAAGTCQLCGRGNGSPAANGSWKVVTLCPACRIQADLEEQQQ